MIRSTTLRVANRLWSPLSSRSQREKARGVRPDVALPFDMFDEVRTVGMAQTASKLEGIYHKGQRYAWNGKEVLDGLVAKHGAIDISPEKQQALQGLFAVILWGELAAWKVSADLALQLEPLEAKMAATSQAHDEARHFYVMHDYLALLGEVPRSLGPRTTRVLTGTLHADTLVKKLVGMQLMIEPMALTLFHLVRRANVEPILTQLVTLYERDEARHVALGVLHLPKLLAKMTPPEALDLWAWEFGEFWAQLAMFQEMEPHFRALGFDPREVIDLGRQKQIRANQMLAEELGAPIPVMDAFIRFFDAKMEWNWPRSEPSGLRDRMLGVWRAATGGAGEVPTALSEVA
jgi:hypothetical protein